MPNETPAAKGHFTMIPNWVIRDSDLSKHELLVYLALLSRADRSGVAWPSLPTLARDSRLSESTARRALADLEVRGIVIREKRPRGNKDNDSNLYRVAQGENRTPAPRGSKRVVGESLAESQRDTPGVSVTPGVVSVGDQPGVSVTPEEDPLKKTQLEEDLRPEQEFAPDNDFAFTDPAAATAKQRTYLNDLFIHMYATVPPPREIESWKHITQKQATDLIDEYLRVMPRYDDYRGPEAGDPEYDALTEEGQHWADLLMTPDAYI